MPYPITAIERSTLPAHEKTAIRRFYDRIGGVGRSVESGVARLSEKLGVGRSVAVSGAHALRSGGEALLVGAALGAAKAQFGSLDVNVPIGDGYTVPGDGVLGLAGLALSMVPSMAAVSEDSRLVGAIGLASWAQRQTEEWVTAKKAPAPPAHAGEYGADPVLSWAASK